MALILVAEDEPDIMTLLSRCLTRDGHDVVHATTGDMALAMTIETKPDLVVLDWMMPEKSGVEVCAALREHPEVRRVRVLMLTARAEDSDLRAAYDAGVDDYLIKPFRAQALRDHVNTLLTRD